MIIKVALPIALNREFDYIVPDSFAEKIEEGVRVKVPFGRLVLTGFVTKIETEYRKPRNIKLREIISLVDDQPYFDKEFIKLAKFISEKWGTPLGLVFSSLVPNYVKVETIPESEEKTAKNTPAYPPPSNLTEEQKTIVDAVFNASQLKTRKPLLLFYDDFADKNEVYSEIFKKSLADNLQTLLLVPDVAFTVFLSEQFEKLFGKENFAIWHGQIPQNQKNKIWHKLHSGKPLIVLGTRSASLLPFKNLSCAIVEQEEDDMYKQEQSKPYYDAREVLQERAKLKNFPVILASPAPSLNSFNETIKDNFKLLRLKSNKPDTKQPDIIITGKKGTKSHIISDKLVEILNKTFKSKKQAMIILNRKGVLNLYACYNCGWVQECKKCHIQMTAEKERLLCPQCRKEEPLPEECPKCRNRIFKHRSYGIRQANSELKKMFPDIKIVQFHSDTLKTKSQKEEVFNAIRTQIPDLIIGTKLLTRGGIFKNLGCAAFLDIDTERSVPDYRTTEKTAQLIFQTKGQLTSPNSNLVIQTAKQDDYLFQSVLKHDYLDFALKELEIRKDLKYPPHAKLIRILLMAPDVKLIEKTAKKIASSLNKTFPDADSFEILGPSPCMFKGSGKFLKHHIIIKYYDDGFLKIFWEVIGKIKAGKSARLKIVADPVDFY